MAKARVSAESAKAVVGFLRTVQKDHGDKLRGICEDIVMKLPDTDEFSSFGVLAQAKLQRQEDSLNDFAAQNATPFG